MIDTRPDEHKSLQPDYNRMRQYLQVSFDISNTQLVGLWNDNTDFYLPYEGENEFRCLGE